MWVVQYLCVVFLSCQTKVPFRYVDAHAQHLLLELFLVVAQCTFEEEHACTVCLALKYRNNN